MRPMSRRIWLVFVITLAVSCAKARVQNVDDGSPSARYPRPGRVVVFDFDTGGSDVVVGTSPVRTARKAVGLSVTEADMLAQAVADALASRLVADVRTLGLAAERAVGA